MEIERLNELRSRINDYVDRRGKLYSPIDHPEFASIPAQHGAERFEPIREHIPSDSRTALDLGTHWGYFAHKLEQLGLEVTAAENMEQYLFFLYRLRELYNDQFNVFPHSVFELEGEVDFDVVLALNIFHHFIKTKKVHEDFADLLKRLKCKVMFFQSHDPNEGQMENAYANYNGDEFCNFIIDQAPRLSRYKRIATFGNRPMYMVT